MSIYNAIASPLEGHKITFPDLIDFIIEAMTPGNDIFDKNEEIRLVLSCLEAPAKIFVPWPSGFSTSTFCLHQLCEANQVWRGFRGI